MCVGNNGDGDVREGGEAWQGRGSVGEVEHLRAELAGAARE